MQLATASWTRVRVREHAVDAVAAIVAQRPDAPRVRGARPARKTFIRRIMDGPASPAADG
jgi:hypothetical protein